MSSIALKRSNVAGRKPGAADIAVGELALNFPDRQLYTKDPSDTIIELLVSQGIANFNSQTSYAAGDFVVHNGSIWRSTKAIVPGTWNAVDWEQLVPTPNSVRTQQLFTNAAGQDTFAFDHNPADLSVYLNGIRLEPKDYSSVDTGHIQLSSALLNATDELFFVTYSAQGSVGARTEKVFTSVAGQDTFAWTHNQNDLDVFLNGILLSNTDYTADGAQVVLTNPILSDAHTLRLISRG